MTAARPRRLVAVLGTATEVGKTWVTVGVLGSLRAGGRTVAARKPAQSFDAPTPGIAADPTDADLLAAATGEDPHDVCPAHRWYGVAMAPPMAADVLGAPRITVGQLVDELVWPAGVDVGFVETAGGVRSPIAEDADCAAFAARLHPDLTVLVADAGLGTINAVRLSMAALDPASPAVVFLNRFAPHDELHVRNRDWLRDRDGLTVLTDLAGLAERCAP